MKNVFIIVVGLVALTSVNGHSQQTTDMDIQVGRIMSLLEQANKAGKLCPALFAAKASLCKPNAMVGSLGPVIASGFCYKQNDDCDKAIMDSRKSITTAGDVRKWIMDSIKKGTMDNRDVCQFIVAYFLPEKMDECLSKAPPRPTSPLPPAK